MAYNTADLTRLFGAGKAYKLGSGKIVPTSTAAETAAAIQQARAADRFGGDLDDQGLRQHLIGRAAAHGIKHHIPASWAREQAAGKSVMCKVSIPEGSTVFTKSGERFTVRRAEWETEAGQAFVKSQRCQELAMKAIDPETREMYLTAARELRRKAGLA